MPTGYTCIIEDGDGCTFEQYLWRRVRAMSATIMMRDSDLDVPITDEAIAGISSYYRDSLAKAQARLAELRGMTPEQAEPLALAEFEQHMRDRDKSLAKSAEEARRYREMRKAVQAWQPPTPEHEGLKQFMLQQISASTEYGPYNPPIPVRLTGAQWLAVAIAKLESSAAYDIEHMAKAKERAAGRIAWVDAIRRVTPQS